MEIHGFVMRGDGVAEVSYSFENEEGKSAAIMRTIVIATDDFQGLTDDVICSLEALVEEASVSIRNPKQSFTGDREVDTDEG